MPGVLVLRVLLCQKVQHRWVDDIKMDHEEIGLDDVD